jgi:cell division protein ZapD
MEQGAEWVVYEHPLNERVRFLLRLEFLFAQYRYHRGDSSIWGLRASLHTLLDALSVMGRADLRSDLVKELADQQAALNRLGKRPEISQERLAETLAQLGAATAELQGMASAYPAMALRSNEFLFAVLNRSSIPGGICGFDLPAYHWWLSRPRVQNERDLDGWMANLLPIERGIDLYLRLLRESTQPSPHTAEGGVYLHVAQAAYQLVRVHLPAAADVLPEISAGKHRVSIRFMRQGDINSRSAQAGGSIPFRLQCCLLGHHP